MRSTLFKSLLYIAYLICATIVGAEVLLRLFSPQSLPNSSGLGLHIPHQELSWVRAPNLDKIVNLGERDVRICTDHRGDRVSCDSKFSACGGSRALVLGDSFVEALSVPFEKTVWHLAEKKTGICMSVAGVGAYYPGQYVRQARLRLEAEEYEFVLLSIYSGNDFVNDIEWRPPIQIVTVPKITPIPKGLSLDELFEWVYPINKWIESRSHLYVASRSILRKYIDPAGIGRWGIPIAMRKSIFTDAYIDATAESVERIATLAADMNIPVLVMVIPTINQVLDPLGEELARVYPSIGNDIDMDLVSNIFVPKISAIENTTVVDLLPTFRSHATRREWGVRDPHFSPQGHQLWWKALEKQLCEVGFDPLESEICKI